jgi:hypothetical protein
MGTDPFTGQKTYAQQIGNRLVPLNVQGGGQVGAGSLIDQLEQMKAQGATLEQKLAIIPSQYREGVKALVEATDLPANYGKANIKANMDMLAHAVDSNFNAARIPYRMGLQKEFGPQGKTGQTIMSFGTAQHHLNEASDAVEELDRQGQGRFPTLNAAKSYLAAHGGNQQLADAVKAYDDAMQAAGSEVAHAYNNGHLGKDEMDKWEELIKSNLPPDRLRRGLYDFTTLLNGKRDTLNDTYRQEFGRNSPGVEAFKEENEALNKKVFSRLPEYSREKRAARAASGGGTQTSAIPSEWTIREH